MRFLPVALVSLAFLLAACGGSEEPGAPVEVSHVETSAAPGTGAKLPRWADVRLAAGKGEDVALVFSTSDYAPGRNRIGFLVVRRSGELVQSPEATVFVARDGRSTPIAAKAELVPLKPHAHAAGTPAHDHRDATDLYVAEVPTPRPGRYWVVVDLAGESVQGVGSLEVKEKSASPPLGSRAPPSETPTLANAPVAKLTTASPPDRELLRYSIADSIRARKPFVVVFATPKFCESRTCGPAGEGVDDVRKQFSSSGIRFMHVEIYEGNDPSAGPNRWVREWRLPSEPWVFVVDANGIIRAKFEGAVSEEELVRAVREHLL